MITSYHPSNPDIKQFINKNWNILEHSIDCVRTFKDKPIMGFKRLPNLRNLLTKAAISDPPKTQNVPKHSEHTLYPFCV